LSRQAESAMAAAVSKTRDRIFIFFRLRCRICRDGILHEPADGKKPQSVEDFPMIGAIRTAASGSSPFPGPQPIPCRIMSNKGRTDSTFGWPTKRGQLRETQGGRIRRPSGSPAGWSGKSVIRYPCSLMAASVRDGQKNPFSRKYLIQRRNQYGNVVIVNREIVDKIWLCNYFVEKLVLGTIAGR